MPIYMGQKPKYDTRDLGYDLSLVKGGFIDQSFEQPVTPEIQNIFSSGVASKSILTGELTAQISNIAGYLQSGNFVTGATGWRINSDGSAEFQNINIGHQIISVNPGDSIQDAIDLVNTAGGGVVFLKAGIHNVTTNLIGYKKVNFIGQGVDLTIIDFGDNAIGLSYDSGGVAEAGNFIIKDLTFRTCGGGDAMLEIKEFQFFRLENVFLNNDLSAGFGTAHGLKIHNCGIYQLDNVFSTSHIGSAFYIFADGTVAGASGAVSFFHCRASDSDYGFNFITADTVDISLFALVDCYATTNDTDGFHFDGAGSNIRELSLVSCVSNSNFRDGLRMTKETDNIKIVGGEFSDNSGYGINIIDSTSKGNIITANTFDNNTSGGILDNGIGTQIDDSNVGLTETELKKHIKMKNTSGGTLDVGDVVVLKAVAAGDQVTTTTTQGDDAVYGMAVESTNNNSYKNFQISGKTTLLKVDGTTNIAIGDFLGTFTTAKIAMKAAAGDMAFARALEAYTNNDSNGVIDALLIKPRKI